MASPGDKVALVWDSKPVGTATVDQTGNWEIAFKARAVKGEHEAYVSAEGEDGNTVIGPQRAFIRPPVVDGGVPRISLKSADTSDKTSQESTAATTELRTGLVVEKIAGAEPGLTMLVGKADPGATVKVIINGKVAGETRVAKDGAWTIAASNPTTKAAKRLRLELHDAKGNKLDQAELPYEVPAASTKVAAVSTIVKLDSPSARKARAKAKPAGDDLAALFKDDAKVADRSKDKIIRVRRGDSLWRIAKRHLGKGRKWAAFYKANKAKIDNPHLIFPGQTLIIPG
jgi:nucleoid-associated protein YgaU